MGEKNLDEYEQLTEYYERKIDSLFEIISSDERLQTIQMFVIAFLMGAVVTVSVIAIFGK